MICNLFFDTGLFERVTGLGGTLILSLGSNKASSKAAPETRIWLLVVYLEDNARRHKGDRDTRQVKKGHINECTTRHGPTRKPLKHSVDHTSELSNL